MPVSHLAATTSVLWKVKKSWRVSHRKKSRPIEELLTAPKPFVLTIRSPSLWRIPNTSECWHQWLVFAHLWKRVNDSRSVTWSAGKIAKNSQRMRNRKTSFASSKDPSYLGKRQGTESFVSLAWLVVRFLVPFLHLPKWSKHNLHWQLHRCRLHQGRRCKHSSLL